MSKRTKQTVKIFDDAAERYQDKYMDVSSYSEGLSLFCDSIRHSAPRILDVASGPGNVAKFVNDKLPDASLTCTDLSSAMLNLVRSNIPLAKTKKLDARDIVTLGQKFDAIIASFIFPYLTRKEVLVFLKDCSSILTDGGVIYISTMDGRVSDSGFVGSEDNQMYMNYHQTDYLEKVLEDCEFDIRLSKLQPYDYGTDNNGIDIILVGQLK